MKRPRESSTPYGSPLKKTKTQEQSHHFCNTSSLAESLVRLFNKPDLSDIIVRVGCHSYHLHKMLLMRSPVFQVMMLGKHWADSKLPHIHLEEAEQCIPHMESFFRYFYSGEVELTSKNVMPLMILANKYVISDLEEACERHACTCVFNGVSTELIVTWWQVANQLCLRNLFRKCKEYMILNMDLVLQCDIFGEFTLEEVECLLLERDLVVSGEYQLFKGLELWLSHKSRQDSYTENLAYLLANIKFCMMTMSELSQIEHSMKGSGKVAELLLPKLLEAYKYHATPFSKRSEFGLSGKDNPRLYTGCKDSVCSMCTTVKLHLQDRTPIRSGLSYKVAIPISTSMADKDSCKTWCLAFRESNNVLNVEASSALSANEQFSMVEAAFLIYKYAHGRTFVKGLMQMRCCVQSLAFKGKAGHVFSMVAPAEALDEDSSYQIKTGDESYCMFKVVMRHYQEDFMVQQQMRMRAAQQQQQEKLLATAAINKNSSCE